MNPIPTLNGYITLEDGTVIQIGNITYMIHTGSAPITLGGVVVEQQLSKETINGTFSCMLFSDLTPPKPFELTIDLGQEMKIVMKDCLIMSTNSFSGGEYSYCECSFVAGSVGEMEKEQKFTIPWFGKEMVA